MAPKVLILKFCQIWRVIAPQDFISYKHDSQLIACFN